jgi:hypothetical protein
MTGFSLKFASISMTACLCVFGLTSPAAAQKGGIRKRTAKKPQKQLIPAPALPAYTPAPLEPLPLEQVPAVAPRVHFSGGELSIVAHNSTLSDVLKEVREQTGAEFEIPPNANERVVADLGPGPARSVLADLLNGTHFNYVMVGSTTDPTAIQSIILTPRTGGPDTTTTAANRAGVPQRGFGQPPIMSTTPAEVAPADDSDSADDAEATDDQAADQQADQAQQNGGQPTTPKTPEQLLQELQRQQQQSQQQNPQSGQPGQPGQPGPPPQGILPNQLPPTAAPTPAKPE